ncbi:hypothetical protein C5U62_03145 [Pseudomonas protegens]|uniref:Uncharacterized protein n=2 Tax=Pseudomonas protegens TaxID=380021 RepID=A0A2T6GTU6_9PSED|nr:hypothetical protein C5U62_03145 [Pseudomonas protegens]
MTNALAGKANKATTLGGYGITDAYPKTGTYSRVEVDELLKYATSLPVGGMVPFPKGAVPVGFLEVDGSVQSVAVYSELAAYLGTTFNRGDEGAGNFRLPESRGEFLRGWDHGRGVDAGRSIGTSQLDQFQGHNRMWNQAGSSSGGSRHTPVQSSTAGTIEALKYPLSAIGEIISDGVNGTPRFGTETRPCNLAVMWCIKAWNAPVNQGNIDVAALAPLAAQATEINQGTARVATAAQMLDGANDLVMPTPKKLRWGFSIGLASNGYIAFPSWLGGLIVQWGRGTNATAGPITVSFPIAFTTSKFFDHAVPIVASPTGWDTSQTAGDASRTQSTFNRRAGNGSSTNSPTNFDVYWFSIGY